MTKPTDVGETALAALATALAAIGDTNVTTWATTGRPNVYREKMHDGALKSSPCIVLPGVYEQCTRDTATNPARYKTVATIPVRCHFDAQTWNPAVDASDWKHDLKKAVGLDPTLGGRCFDVTIMTVSTILNPPDEAPSCKIAMDLTLEWFWAEDDPSVAIP